MDETSVYLTSQKHTAKKKEKKEKKKKRKEKKKDEAKSNKPTHLEALWNRGWQQSIQC